MISVSPSIIPFKHNSLKCRTILIFISVVICIISAMQESEMETEKAEAGTGEY